MKSILILLFAVLALYTGCDTEQRLLDKVGKEFAGTFEKVTGKKVDAGRAAYMVIPRAGCGGCISSAESQMLNILKNPANSNIYFILTDFESEKILKARFKDVYLDHRVILDNQNQFQINKSLKSIYPGIYFFNASNELYKVSEVSVKQDGLTDLSNFIKEFKQAAIK